MEYGNCLLAPKIKNVKALNENYPVLGKSKSDFVDANETSFGTERSTNFQGAGQGFHNPIIVVDRRFTIAVGRRFHLTGERTTVDGGRCQGWRSLWTYTSFALTTVSICPQRSSAGNHARTCTKMRNLGIKNSWSPAPARRASESVENIFLNNEVFQQAVCSNDSRDFTAENWAFRRHGANCVQKPFPD